MTINDNYLKIKDNDHRNHNTKHFNESMIIH